MPGEESRKKFKVNIANKVISCVYDGNQIAIPEDTFTNDFSDSYVGWIGPKNAVVATYAAISGFAYQIAGIQTNTNKIIWRKPVWAADRRDLGGIGFHYVELIEKNGLVYLFGMESHGAYLEVFDVVTGKKQYGFCSCYWNNYSEKWVK